jgi:hypothetical protein
LLGPLVDAAGTASAFTLKFALHPGESLALDYLRRTGRKRAVPGNAVQEVLRHAGYLQREAEALVSVLTDRGLATEVAGGLRPVVCDQSECEKALAEITTLRARVRKLVGDEGLPEMAEGGSLRVLWAHLDSLRETLKGTINDLRQQLEQKAGWLRCLIGGNISATDAGLSPFNAGRRNHRRRQGRAL